MEFCYIVEKYGNDYVLPVNKENMERIELLKKSPDVAFCYEADVQVHENEVRDKSYLDVVLAKFRILLNSHVDIEVGSALTKHWLESRILSVKADFIDRLLKLTGGDVQAASRRSGFGRKSIYKMALRVGINIDNYR